MTFHGWDDPSLGLLDFNLIWPVQGASVSGTQNVAIEAYGGGELKGGYALSIQVFD